MFVRACVRLFWPYQLLLYINIPSVYWFRDYVYAYVFYVPVRTAPTLNCQGVAPKNLKELIYIMNVDNY